MSYADLEESVLGQPTVDPERFVDSSAEVGANAWAAGAEPASWEGVPEERLLARETMQLIRRTIDGLPEAQRLTITLHDLDQLPATEICSILGISETNQRVLLHRARAKVRDALERYLQAEHGWKSN